MKKTEQNLRDLSDTIKHPHIHGSLRKSREGGRKIFENGFLNLKKDMNVHI